ncbi:MAG TPA: SEC-C domain-containing protein [Candidatus Saccharimonadales bacterium]|nr:SEC-C domain-containing protein [Candidatus Saccharimonadales bacterium]
MKDIEYSKLTKGDISKFKNAGGRNYISAILEAIIAYNHRAQLDIAQQMLAVFDRAEKAGNRFLQINVINKIFTLWFELSDQYYLLFKLLETSNWEEFIKTNNSQAQRFFDECANGLPELRIYKVMGIPARTNIRDRVKQAIEAHRKNASMLGGVYASTTNALYGSYAIKHGYKVVYPTALSEKIFEFDGNDSLILVSVARVTKIPSNGREKNIIETGRLSRNQSDERKVLQGVIKNMEIYANAIKDLAELGSRRFGDRYYYLSASLGLMKIGANDACPCQTKKRSNGKPEKYKHCHGQK